MRTATHAGTRRAMLIVGTATRRACPHRGARLARAITAQEA
jgi:hypothetical protein